MSTCQRWFSALFVLCCAASLPVGAWAEAPAAPQHPSVAETLPSAKALEPATPAVDEKTQRGEPAVRKTVVEDDGARIDELKVRGQTKRITVTPKKVGKPYEIIPPSGAPDQTEGPNGSNGSVGKRVWPVLSF
ncbi:MAG: hypothetical protein Q7T97_07130 [Burkholderiaceae bacterium]|nr:hypothetical protein [Burkholderiaceae bacterium]